MGSLGAVGMITMRDGRPSFEVDSGQIEVTYPIGARTETLTRVTANASGVFISVYNGATLLGGGGPGQRDDSIKFRGRGPSELDNSRRAGRPRVPHGRYRIDMGLNKAGRLFAGYP